MSATDPVPVTPKANPAEKVIGVIPSNTGQGTSLNYAGLPAGTKGTGGKLLGNDATGKPVFGYYDLQLDANILYQTMDESERKTILTGLALKGLYGSSRPFADPDNDRNVLSELLLYANIANVDYKKAYQQYVQTMPNSTGAKKAPSIRVTSKDDLDVVFRKTAQDLLGYELPPDAAKRFAQSYNQLEIQSGQQAAAGGVYTAEAAPGTVAEQQIRKQFAPEAQSFAAGNYAEIMDRRIKELGA